MAKEAAKVKEIEAIRSGGNVTIPAIQPYAKKQGDHIKSCPYCSENIFTVAKKCPYCRSNLEWEISPLTVFLIIAAVGFGFAAIVSASEFNSWGYKDNAITDTLKAVIALKTAIYISTSFILWGLLNIRWK